MRESQEQLFSSQNSEPSKNTIDQLFHHALEFKGSEQYKRFFSFIAKFNHYSRYNTMLVYLQNPAVTFFGTSSYWNSKFNRNIAQNAKPLLILAPGGPVILAYDVFDTTGRKSPKQFLEEGLAIDIFQIKGSFVNSYLDDIVMFCDEYQINVTEKPLNYFNAGAVTTKIDGRIEINLKEEHEPNQHFATICHELAHIFLGHLGSVELRSNQRKRSIRILERPLQGKYQELEAETVSFLVCKRFGLETKSVEYLATYITDDQDWEHFSYDQVIKTSDKIADLITPVGLEVDSKTQASTVNEYPKYNSESFQPRPKSMDNVRDLLGTSLTYLARFNRPFLIVGIILFFFVLTNPSRADFKDFLGYPERLSDYVEAKRDRNYYVCSIYSEFGTRYLGIAGNFFKIEESK